MIAGLARLGKVFGLFTPEQHNLPVAWMLMYRYKYASLQDNIELKQSYEDQVHRTNYRPATLQAEVPKTGLILS